MSEYVMQVRLTDTRRQRTDVFDVKKEDYSAFYESFKEKMTELISARVSEIQEKETVKYCRMYCGDYLDEDEKRLLPSADIRKVRADITASIVEEIFNTYQGELEPQHYWSATLGFRLDVKDFSDEHFFSLGKEDTPLFKQLFVVRDKNGHLVLFPKDPIVKENRRELGFLNAEFEKLLSDYRYDATLLNPLRMKISVSQEVRGEMFDLAYLADIRSGKLKAKIVDFDGNEILLKEDTDRSSEYFLIGNVLDKNGHAVGERRYSAVGESSDKDKAKGLSILFV